MRSAFVCFDRPFKHDFDCLRSSGVDPNRYECSDPVQTSKQPLERRSLGLLPGIHRSLCASSTSLSVMGRLRFFMRAENYIDHHEQSNTRKKRAVSRNFAEVVLMVDLTSRRASFFFCRRANLVNGGHRFFCSCQHSYRRAVRTQASCE